MFDEPVARGNVTILASEKENAERQACSSSNYLLYLLHLKTYDFTVLYCEGKRVLDIGCGEGYGVCRIAPTCTETVGIDIEMDAIVFARANFTLGNTCSRAVRPAETGPLPFEDRNFDTVITFQGIEQVFGTNASGLRRCQGGSESNGIIAPALGFTLKRGD